MDSNNTSSNISIEMSSEAFAAVNVPVSVFSILLNISFVFCIFFPQQGAQRLKQPLTVLLGSLVGCNIAAHICILVMVVMVFFSYFDSFFLWWCIPQFPMYIMMISVNSSHWLNVFYCFQIIPVQRPFFIWFKRNFRVFICCALIINAAICLLGLSVNIAVALINNDNMTDQKIDLTALYTSFDTAFWMTLSLFIFSLFVMLASSCVTVVFLWRHMKYMKNSSDSFSSSRRQKQIRVTIISISVQALLHITCSTLVIIDQIIVYQSPYLFDIQGNILCTVVSLYSFVTTINLGLSQSVFRQRAVHIWQKCFRPKSSLSASTTVQASFSNILSI